MAELPQRPRDDDTGTTRFPALDLHVDGRSLYVQRLDAQAAVDVARKHNMAARQALVAASSTRILDTGPARVAADDTAAVLRTAVAVLTAFDELHGVVAAHLQVDVEHDPDGPMTMVRPHGEIDLLTAPHLEAVCVEQLDGAPLDLLVVDLSAVTFLDSSGLAVLVELHRVCGQGDTRFAVTGATRKTQRLLEITRLDNVLDII